MNLNTLSFYAFVSGYILRAIGFFIQRNNFNELHSSMSCVAHLSAESKLEMRSSGAPSLRLRVLNVMDSTAALAFNESNGFVSEELGL